LTYPAPAERAGAISASMVVSTSGGTIGLPAGGWL